MLEATSAPVSREWPQCSNSTAMKAAIAAWRLLAKNPRPEPVPGTGSENTNVGKISGLARISSTLPLASDVDVAQWRWRVLTLKTPDHGAIDFREIFEAN